MAGIIWKQQPTTESEATPRNIDSAWFAGLRSVLIERSITNLVQNPSFEVNVSTGWDQVNVTRVTDASKFGAASALSSAAFGGGGAYLIRQTTATGAAASPGDVFAGSVWVKVDTNSAGAALHLRLRWLDAGGAELSQSTLESVSTTTAGWVRLSGSATAPALTATVTINCAWIGAASTVHAYLDGFQLETGVYCTSYADGAQGEGYAWTGTANASTSTRTVGLQSFPDVAPRIVDEGSVVLWLEPQQVSTTGLGPATSYFFQFGASGDALRLRYLRSTGILALRANHTTPLGADLVGNSEIAAAWAAGEPVCMYAGWGPDGALTVGFNGTFGPTEPFYPVTSPALPPYLAGGSVFASSAPNAAFSAAAFFTKQLPESLFAQMADITAPPHPGDFAGSDMLALFIADEQPA